MTVAKPQNLYDNPSRVRLVSIQSTGVNLPTNFLYLSDSFTLLAIRKLSAGKEALEAVEVHRIGNLFIHDNELLQI
jgi:hypothetical protein